MLNIVTGLYFLIAPISAAPQLYQAQAIAHEATDPAVRPDMFIAFRRLVAHDQCERLRKEFAIPGSRCEQLLFPRT